MKWFSLVFDIWLTNVLLNVKSLKKILCFDKYCENTLKINDKKNYFANISAMEARIFMRFILVVHYCLMNLIFININAFIAEIYGKGFFYNKFSIHFHNFYQNKNLSWYLFLKNEGLWNQREHMSIKCHAIENLISPI